MTSRVRKAVFPVAGLGTRFLPATKAMAKEMLTVVDRPLIQYAVEEARDAGIEEFIFVTGRGKAALEDHFDRAYELEDTLKQRNKEAELKGLAAWQPPLPRSTRAHTGPTRCWLPVVASTRSKESGPGGRAGPPRSRATGSAAGRPTPGASWSARPRRYAAMSRG